MSRFWDKDVLRRAYQIGAERCRRGEAGDWIGDHHQAYRERVHTPLEKRIQREWGGDNED